MSKRTNRNTASVGQLQAQQRQLLRRSNAAVPIPMGQHKTPRSTQRQILKEEYR